MTTASSASGPASFAGTRRGVGLNPARIGPPLPRVHRFRIGMFEAAIVSDGPLVLPEMPWIYPDLPRGVIGEVLEAEFLPAEGKVVAEQNCLLVDIGGHIVLFDNGMGASAMFGPHAGRLERNLAGLGLRPEDVDALVLSHAHPDHCWGTTRADGSPAFPNAGIYVAERELAFWEAHPEADRATVRGVRTHLLPLRDRITLIRDGEEFLPGLHALAAPGHTPGHTVFIVTSREEEACVLGDVAFHHVLSFAHPRAVSDFDLDRAEAAETRLRMLRRLAEERMRVVGYHLPWPGIGHVAREATARGATARGDGFRWVAEAAPEIPA